MKKEQRNMKKKLRQKVQEEPMEAFEDRFKRIESRLNAPEPTTVATKNIRKSPKRVWAAVLSLVLVCAVTTTTVILLRPEEKIVLEIYYGTDAVSQSPAIYEETQSELDGKVYLPNLSQLQIVSCYLFHNYHNGKLAAIEINVCLETEDTYFESKISIPVDPYFDFPDEGYQNLNCQAVVCDHVITYSDQSIVNDFYLTLGMTEINSISYYITYNSFMENDFLEFANIIFN